VKLGVDPRADYVYILRAFSLVGWEAV